VLRRYKEESEDDRLMSLRILMRVTEITGVVVMVATLLLVMTDKRPSNVPVGAAPVSVGKATEKG
jgi:hypothetical protein